MNPHDVLDAMKLAFAQEVLRTNSMADIRRKSLDNLERWQAKDTWCFAFGEWRELLTHCSDADVTAAMTGLDQNANRLRQSPPYTGLLSEEKRKEIWAAFVLLR